MKPLSQYAGEELQLVQPSIWKRVYELRTPETVLCTMSCPKLFSSLAIIEGFGEKWEIYRSRWWSRNFEIRKQGTELPFAKFIGKRFGGDGIFEFPMGERMLYRYIFWKNADELVGEYQERLVLFKKKISFKSEIDIVIEKQTPLLDKYPWIVMTVYRIILERRSHTTH